MPEALFDRKRIFLREGYSQPEFYNLMTLKRINIVLKSKRRRYLMQNNNIKIDARCPKYKPTIKSEKEQEKIYPTALHILDSSNAEDNVLSKLERDAKVDIAEKEDACNVNEDENERVVAENEGAVLVEIKDGLESISEQDSWDGGQLNNLVKVAVSGLDIVEKLVASSRASPDPIINDAVQTGRAEEETTDDTAEKTNKTAILDRPVVGNINKTFDVQKDQEYKDIFEENLEVSEILDKDDFSRTGAAKKAANLPERY